MAVTEQHGYEFENVAGTSAGAIVAALVAAGYDAAGPKEILRSLDYQKFLEKSFVDRIPLLGPALSLGFEKGIYEGDFLESWLRDHLARQGVREFGGQLAALLRETVRQALRRRERRAFAPESSLAEPGSKLMRVFVCGSPHACSACIAD